MKSSGLKGTLRRRGDPQVFFHMFVQAGPGTQELPTPRAEDGIPQLSAALLTVTAVRHRYSKFGLSSEYFFANTMPVSGKGFGATGSERGSSGSSPSGENHPRARTNHLLFRRLPGMMNLAIEV
jgi:hypothetical protein